MSYTLNYTDTITNPNGIVVEDYQLNTTDTSLAFVGKNFTGYSEYIGENFLHLLENFASSTPPSPEQRITGQLWYDTSASKPQLKVFNGTEWAETSGIKTADHKPSNASSAVGDLWVDTALQQLYMYTGSDWVLVGPNFAESETNGIKIEEVVSSSSNIPKKIVSCFVDAKRVAVFSKEEFVPKRAVEGFPVIKTGLTLSSIPNNGLLNKFWGVAEKAEALIVNNNTVPASRFLRNDTSNTTNYPLNIQTGQGISIGPSLETSLTSSLSGTVLHQKAGASIILRTTTVEAGLSTTNDSIVVNNGQVGINKIPGYLPDNISQAALDVNGSAQVNGLVRLTDTTLSTSVSTGALVVTGGVGVGGNITVGGSATVNNTLTVSSNILPASTNSNVGSTGQVFNAVHAQTVLTNKVGNANGTTEFTGTFIGNVSGSAGSLRRSVEFSLTGDVSSEIVTTNGSSNVTLNAVIDPNFLISKPQVSDFQPTDEVFIHRFESESGLKRLRISALFENQGVIPVGSVIPFAGNVVPNGYLLCDGSEVSKTQFAKLYSAIGNSFNTAVPLISTDNFRLPDFRGRSAIGNQTMNNNLFVTVNVSASEVNRLEVPSGALTARFVAKTAAIIGGSFQPGKVLSGTDLPYTAIISAVTVVNDETLIDVSVSSVLAYAPASGYVLNIASTADIAASSSLSNERVPSANSNGIVGGDDSVSLAVSNLPDHEHTLQDDANQQYYAVRLGTDTSSEAIAESIQTDGSNVYMLPTSSSVKAPILNQPFSIMNPFLTVNYIIFAGGTA